jgi:hypothetical protein
MRLNPKKSIKIIQINQSNFRFLCTKHEYLDFGAFPFEQGFTVD